jgi:hypothetical protein
LDVGVPEGGAKNEAADAAKSVDSNWYGHLNVKHSRIGLMRVIFIMDSGREI